MRYIESLKEGERISEVYICRSKSILMTKAGKEYASIILADKTGQLDGKIWDLNSGGIDDFEALDYVHATGLITLYNGSFQFKIERIRVAQESEYVASDYIPCSRFDIEEMYTQFLSFSKTIENKYIKKLLDAFFIEDTEFIQKFKSMSAGKSVHHGFYGGLLEHSLSVTKLCSSFAGNYPFLNRDLLVSCAMLHDCGKVRELSSFPKNDYTDEGNFLGHIVMGYEMIVDKIKNIPDFPEVLKSEIGHCILAHHRMLEYGSPKKPAIAEALALAYADDCDAKMEIFREACEEKNTNDWLGYNKWIDSNIKKTIV